MDIIRSNKPWIPKPKIRTEVWAHDDRYHTTQWRRYRSVFLKENPLCIECKQAGKLTPSTIVGHIKPVRTHPDLFWEKSNHKPLCTSCNNRTNKK
jgi:5-methylcytosine-specific restriction protein A